MSLTLAEIDDLIDRSSRNKKVSVDGMSHEGHSISELLRLRAAIVAESASASGKRPVLRQRMRSSSGGDSQ